MTGLAGLRELRSDVVGHAPAEGLRQLEILLVTGNTSRRKPLKLSDRRTLMAIVALHSRVRSEQRETILVIFHLLHGNLPSLHRVAVRAVRAHFVLMDVGVAVFAIHAHVGEDGFHMTLNALHSFVLAPQRISCFVVIELGNGLDRPPSCRGVAVFTGDGQRTVRTTGVAVAALPLRKASTACCQREQQHPERELEISRRVALRGRSSLGVISVEGGRTRISNREP